MGGLLMFVAVTVPFLILGKYNAISLGVWGTAMACAALGFYDDYLKLTKRHSSGLPGRWKLLVQAVLAVALWYMAKYQVNLSDELKVRPFDVSISLGYFYPVLIFLV